MSKGKTLEELAGASGIPARTIRYYIARGLLEGPVKAGRGAVYTSDHLARLEKIQALQAKGRMLAEIVHDLSKESPSPPPAQPVPWWQHAVQDDVMVWVRGDVSPWRMKRIRAAVDDMARRLQEPDGKSKEKS